MDLIIYLILLVVLTFKLPVNSVDNDVITDSGYTQQEILTAVPVGNNLSLKRDLSAYKKILKELKLIV